MLDARELADLELIATGAASPLTGFLGTADYASVVERAAARGRHRVAAAAHARRARRGDAPTSSPGARSALDDAAGRLWGVIEVERGLRRATRSQEARHVYGTEDPAHPGVAYLLARPRTLVGGPVRVLPLPEDLPFAEHRLTPRALRAEIAERGWRRVAGFQTRNPIHRAHEHLTKLALEFADGLVIHPLVGETKGDDVPAAVRFQAYEALIDAYYPPERTLLAAFPAAMRYAGPREALFHALVRKNYGITHLIVGRDHAGVGRYYGPYEAQQIFDRFTAERARRRRRCKLRADLLLPRLRHARLAAHLPARRGHAARAVGHARCARSCASGGRLPAQVHAARRWPRCCARTTAARRARAGREPRPASGGFIVWFTGLSGAGKSTLAQALQRAARRRAPGRDPRRRRGAHVPVEGPRLLARRTATRTSAASATWRGCSRATASP